MTDIERILPLWRELHESGADYVLATIVAVEGSSYRKPGAHMILAEDGRRAGTVSGGCLEAEVARRAWWLTSEGPVVERYSTVDDDGDRPYGSGCGGVVSLLLERRETVWPLMAALDVAFNARTPLAVATVLEGPAVGRRAFAGLPHEPAPLPSANPLNADGGFDLTEMAALALNRRTSIEAKFPLEGVQTRVWTDYRAARPGLWIFSAGDDAMPLVQLARGLSWFVAVADGRSHLATRQRFPAAHEVRVLPIADLPDAAPAHMKLLPADAAVVMTHSFEQDSRVLASLLGLDFKLPYIGVLGPHRRTRELLAEAARLLHLPVTSERVERWLAEMHAPTGLDLGGDSPATIALSIVAEIQKVMTAATGRPMRQVRAEQESVARS